MTLSSLLSVSLASISHVSPTPCRLNRSHCWVFPAIPARDAPRREQPAARHPSVPLRAPLANQHKLYTWFQLPPPPAVAPNPFFLPSSFLPPASTFHVMLGNVAPLQVWSVE